MTYYVPGTEEKDPSKVIMSLQQAHEKTATNTDDIATNAADIAALQSSRVTGPSSATDNALVRFDGTTGKLVQDSEITLGDSDGKLTRTAGISISGTNTNDSAAAGYVGEFVTNSSGSVALTSNTGANLTSISLTAGDWDVSGGVIFAGTGTTTSTDLWLSINTVSAVNVNTPGLAARVRGATFTDPIFDFPVGPYRVSLSSTTTYYLNAQAQIGASTLNAQGFIQARRVR